MMDTATKIFLYIAAVALGCSFVLIHHNKNIPDDHGMLACKPVIYLYPEEPKNYEVEVDFSGEFTFIYPDYDGSWHVNAKSSGELEVMETGKTYNYLFWEGITPKRFDFDKGFVVKREQTTEFLEDKLAVLGLNSKEAADFITFWAPRMVKNDYYLVKFLTIDEIHEFASIKVLPEVDSEIRVYMIYRPCSGNMSIEEQVLETPNRTGDVMVEWGGAEYD